MVHWWDDKGLAVRFKNKDVPEKEKFTYLMIFICCMSLQSILGALSSLDSAPSNEAVPVNGQLLLLSSLIFNGLIIAGTIATYKTNAEGDNSGFIERCVAFSFPIMTKMIVFALPLAFVTGFGLRFLHLGHMTLEAIVINIIILFCFYFYRLNECMKIASGQK